jgi:hypothetical protein
MKKLSLQLALLISVFAVVHTGCARPEPSNSAANQPVNSNQASSANVASSMKMVAYHFEKKLEAYEGKLISLQVSDGTVNAVWESKKCDSLKKEAIDLVISTFRGYNESIKSINAQRTCDSSQKTFSISGEKFDQYTKRKIGDPQLTEGIE